MISQSHIIILITLLLIQTTSTRSSITSEIPPKQSSSSFDPKESVSSPPSSPPSNDSNTTEDIKKIGDYVPRLDSNDAYVALRLDPYHHKLVYFYASETFPSSLNHHTLWSEIYVLTSPYTRVQTYRVDCDAPSSLMACITESPLLSTFPAIVYYRGNEAGKVWTPKIRNFDGKDYTQSYAVPFIMDFVNRTLTGPLCTHRTLHGCTDEEQERIQGYGRMIDAGTFQVEWVRVVGEMEDARVGRIEEIVRPGMPNPTEETEKYMLELEVTLKLMIAANDGRLSVDNADKGEGEEINDSTIENNGEKLVGKDKWEKIQRAVKPNKGEL